MNNDSLYNFNNKSDDSESLKLNMDELYIKKQQQDLNILNNYNKILSRIHNKIKFISKQLINDQCCWYIMPEMMIGIPKYNCGDCTAYVIEKLRTNGFVVRYTHPNLLFISWKHWVPSYVRNEIHKRTGYKVDGMGKIIDKPLMKSTTNQQEHLQKQERETSLFSGNRESNSNYNSNSQNQGDSKTSKFFQPSVKSIYNLSFFNDLNKKL